MKTFEPDYRYMLQVMANGKPARMPVYEHIIDPVVMEKILDVSFAELIDGDEKDRNEFFKHYCRFFKEMTYDTVSFEMLIVDLLPGHGAIFGGCAGPIQNRSDFEAYSWEDIPRLFREKSVPCFDALRNNIPDGMKALGGVGNGVFEISEDLVGYEYLSYMMLDDPELFRDLYVKIGDLILEIRHNFLEDYNDLFAICRMGDDLGFKTSTLISPENIREHIIPQYKRIAGQVKSFGIPFLWHSCGNIFDVMDDVIATGINAKHSNEDAVAPFDTWIERYNDRIALLGGIDVDILCRETPENVFDIVYERGKRFRDTAKGYALGSGNSIPDYIPPETYLAMIEAAKKIRETE